MHVDVTANMKSYRSYANMPLCATCFRCCSDVSDVRATTLWKLHPCTSIWILEVLYQSRSNFLCGKLDWCIRYFSQRLVLSLLLNSYFDHLAIPRYYVLNTYSTIFFFPNTRCRPDVVITHPPDTIHIVIWLLNRHTVSCWRCVKNSFTSFIARKTQFFVKNSQYSSRFITCSHLKLNGSTWHWTLVRSASYYYNYPRRK